MSLRIGFDMDGVLADMDLALLTHAEALFGDAVVRRVPAQAEAEAGAAVAPSAASADLPAAASGGGQPQEPSPAAEDIGEDSASLPRLSLSSRQTRRLWHHVEAVENFWETLAETEEGVVSRLAALAADRRWEPIFLTKRPQSAGATSQVQSQRWLESKGFPLPSVYVVQGSRGQIAAALGLDIVVDDRPENCLDVVTESRARAILVWRDDEKLMPAATRRLGIGVVKTVGECLDILSQIGHSPDDRPGLMDRVKRLLGLVGDPAGA